MPFQPIATSRTPCNSRGVAEAGTSTRRQIIGLIPTRRTFNWRISGATDIENPCHRLIQSATAPHVKVLSIESPERRTKQRIRRPRADQKVAHQDEPRNFMRIGMRTKSVHPLLARNAAIYAPGTQSLPCKPMQRGIRLCP